MAGMRPRATVVGAGISGLVAALELAPTHDVTVLEAGPVPGGVLQRRTVGGITLDLGAESMLARRPEGVDLATSLGLPLVHPATTRAAVATPTGLAPLPTGTVMGVPRDAASLEGFLPAADVERVRSETTRPAAPLEHDVTVASYVAERVGPAVVDRLVEPLLGGVYAGHAARLSLQATVPALWNAARAGGSLLQHLGPVPAAAGPVFAGLDGGLAVLPQVLAGHLHRHGVTIRTGTAVHRVRRSPDGWLVDGTPTDAVVLAVPAPVAARLLREAVPAAAAELADVETASMVITALAVPAHELAGLQGSGVLVPPVVAAADGLRVKALTLSGNKWDWVGEQPGDHREELAVLRVSLGRAGEGEALQAEDRDVLRWATRDASALLGRALHPVDHAVVRWVDALPQYAVGHVQKVARIRAAVAGVPGLALCGSVLDGVGVPACIAAARRAASDVTDRKITKA